MRDVDDRQRQPVAQAFEERQDLVLGRAVERRERLVHQQELRLRQERAADCDPLAFAAGKLAWRAVEQSGDAEKLDDFVERDFRPTGVVVVARRAEQEVAAHREMRKQARLLEHIAERAPMGRQKSALRVLPDLAGDDAKSVREPLEAGDAAQHRGLAAA